MPQIRVDSKTINLNKIIIVVIILILLVGNIYFSSKYFNTLKELEAIKAAMETFKINDKIITFISLFTAKVLKTENEVNFESRLQLENAVRDINDKDILEQWQKFTDSQTEVEAQIEVKNLLEILVNKIKM